MINWLAVSALLLAMAGVYSASNDPKKIVCYFGSWAVYRPNNGKFEVEDIHPELCTHLVYSFVGITADGGIRILDALNDLPEGKDAIKRFNNLRTRSPAAKTLVAIGGWNEGSALYSQVMNNAATRSTFVQNVVKFVQQHGFNGFDLDWEYPGQRGGSASDKAAYVLLIREMRKEFDKYGLILSAAVGVGQYLVASSYDVKELSQNLDIINMMSYDLHGAWDGVTGQNAPLYARRVDSTAAARTLNVDASIRYWIDNGASPEKLVLGIGTYGRTFTLSNTASSGLGAPTSGPGLGGPYTQEAGMLGYNEICEKQMNGAWKTTWDDEQKVPYAVDGNQWVGYDNVESIKLKAQYATDLGLGGAMIWSLETDDFQGICHNKKFPLLSAINEVFNTGSTGGAVTPSSSTSDNTPSTSTASSGGSSSGVCKAEGLVRDPSDCQVFYQCILVNGVYIPNKFNCAGDLVFDPSINACNYKFQVSC